MKISHCCSPKVQSEFTSSPFKNTLFCHLKTNNWVLPPTLSFPTSCLKETALKSICYILNGRLTGVFREPLTSGLQQLAGLWFCTCNTELNDTQQIKKSSSSGPAGDSSGGSHFNRLDACCRRGLTLRPPADSLRGYSATLLTPIRWRENSPPEILEEEPSWGAEALHVLPTLKQYLYRLVSNLDLDHVDKQNTDNINIY